LPSIYFDVLHIIRHWNVILRYEMNIKNSGIKGNSVSCLLEYLNGIAEVVGSNPTGPPLSI
jgi:hypothetical protein